MLALFLCDNQVFMLLQFFIVIKNAIAKQKHLTDKSVCRILYKVCSVSSFRTCQMRPRSRAEKLNCFGNKGVEYMNFDNIAHVNLLFDFYGKLLTKRQKEAMELYYEENLSLSEIADEFQISRQGVHDALKNAEKALKGYEEKLGLVEKMQQSRQAMEEIDASIDELTAHCSDSAMAEKLQKIKTIIDKQLDQ